MLSVLLFTGLLSLLTVLILWVRARLVPQGDVTINVNDERDLHVAVGSKLLATLAENQLFVPSACGGGGTCGQCRVVVAEGGGSLLPTEASLITKREAATGERLACQVAVTQDMRIRVPEAVFGVKKWQCKVRSNDNVATFIKELIRRTAGGRDCSTSAPAAISRSNVRRTELRYDSFAYPAGVSRRVGARYGLFELESVVKERRDLRAYSMANYPEESDIVMLNVRIATPPPAGTAVRRRPESCLRSSSI